MAYLNKQMNHPVDGIRINTPSKCKELFNGITWDNIYEHFITWQEYGNTLFCDAIIIAFYFKCKFNLKQTMIGIGYRGSKKNNQNYPTQNLSRRLARINTKSVIIIARELWRAELINKQTIQTILTKQVLKHAGNNLRITNSKCYLYYAKAIVTSSIEKFGTRKKSAKKLGITSQTINYWVNLKVIDIRIKPTE